MKGLELIEYIIESSSLPQGLIAQEIQQILQSNNLSLTSVSAEDLREAMLKYAREILDFPDWNA